MAKSLDLLSFQEKLPTTVQNCSSNYHFLNFNSKLFNKGTGNPNSCIKNNFWSGNEFLIRVVKLKVLFYTYY